MENILLFFERENFDENIDQTVVAKQTAQLLSDWCFALGQIQNSDNKKKNIIWSLALNLKLQRKCSLWIERPIDS